MPDSVAPDPQLLLERTRAHAHAGCFFCGVEHPTGMHLRFHAHADGSVTAGFRCGPLFESYRGTLHGGMIAALLDSAMTHCLFSRGIVAVTADLSVRFLIPAKPDEWTEVSARLVRARPPLYRLHAELVQDGVLVSRADARFMGGKM